MLEMRLAQAAGVLCLDDLVRLCMQLDVVTDAPAERARRVLYDLHRPLLIPTPVACRPYRATRETFKPVPGRAGFRACAGAGTDPLRSQTSAARSLQAECRT